MSITTRLQNYFNQRGITGRLNQYTQAKRVEERQEEKKKKHIEMYNAALEDTQEAQKRAKYLSSPIGMIKSAAEEFGSGRTQTKLAKGILNLGKSALQETARSGASVGLSSIATGVERFGPKIRRLAGLDPDIKEMERRANDIRKFEVDNPIAKAVFGGDRPLRAVETRIAEGELAVEDVGKALEKADIPVPYTNKIGNLIKRGSLPISFLGTAAFVGMDFTGAGASKKALKETAEQIAKTTSRENIERQLKTVVAASDNGIEKLATDLISLNKTDDVVDVIQSSVRAGRASSEKATATAIKRLDEISEGRKMKTVKQQFRMDKLNLTDTQADQVAKRLEAIGLDRRKVRTFGELEETALELGTNPKTLLKESTDNMITDAEVKALRNIINANSNHIASVSKKMGQATEAEAKILQRQINTAEQQMNQALRKLVKGGTEAGRTISAFRLTANRTLDRAYWLRKARKLLGKDLDLDTIKNIDEMIEGGNVNNLAHFVAGLRVPGGLEKGITLWKAGLLTSPTTQLANYGGNITMAGLETIKDVPAVGLDLLFSLFTKQRKVATSPRIAAKKGWNILKGVTDVGVTNFTKLANTATRGRVPVKTLGEAGEYLKTGIYSQRLLAKYDLNSRVVFKSPLAQGYINTIFRNLGAGDIVFRKAAMEESLEKQAKMIAKNEGLIGDTAKKRIKNLLTSPTVDMEARAIDAAEYATFMSKNPLADMVSGAKGAVRGKGVAGEAAEAGLEVAAPFVRTPTDIAARIADYTPAGFAKAVIQSGGGVKNQEKVAETLGRAVTGTGILALGSLMFKKGLITGNPPETLSERDQWYAEGKQRNSIRIAGHWYQMDRTSPFGNLLTLGASLQELSEKERGISRYTGAGAEALSALSEQTFLRGVSGLTKALVKPQRYAGKYTETTLSSFVPTIITRAARTKDPTLRVSEGLLQEVQRKLPIAREKLPSRTNIWGEPVKLTGGRGRFSLIDPFNVSPAEKDPLIEEAKKVDFIITKPGDTIANTEMTPKEYYVYSTVYGRTLKRSMKALTSSEKYKELTSLEKKKELDSLTRSVRSELQDELFPAIMIKRYDIPNESHPEVVKEVISQLNQIDKFKQATKEKQKETVQNLVSKYQTELTK